jgi:hypothetical protein
LVAQTRLGYGTAHRWVRSDRGPASRQTCVDCGQAAAEWSYAHERATERRFDPLMPTAPFSLDPADYDPRCIRCHKHYDRAARKSANP